MPLPSIQFDNGGQEKWHFDHWEDHLEIINAIQAQGGPALTQWPIYPFTPEDTDTWLRLHQSMHSDMNNALGISGSNLQQVNFQIRSELDAFYDMNFLEHSNAREALGI